MNKQLGGICELLWSVRLGARRTADPSASLRSGRDDKGRDSVSVWGRSLNERTADRLGQEDDRSFHGGKYDLVFKEVRQQFVAELVGVACEPD